MKQSMQNCQEPPMSSELLFKVVAAFIVSTQCVTDQ